MLQVAQLKKKYGDRIVLQVDAAEIGPGIHWFQGVNGSGKSTFLKIVGGLIPFDGDVSLNGISLKKEPVAYRQLVSYAEAEPVFPGFLTGKDLLHFVASVRKEEFSAALSRAEQLNTTSFIGQRTDTYSSGMLKKLSIVLAFIGAPSYVLLDEPLVTLDVATVSTLIKMMNDLVAAGTTVLFTSHQLSELEHLSAVSTWQVDHQTICKLS